MDSKHQGPPRRAHSQNLHLALAPQEQSLPREAGLDGLAPLPYPGGSASTGSCSEVAGSRSPRTSSEPDGGRAAKVSLRPPREPLRGRVPGGSPRGRSLCEPRPPRDSLARLGDPDNLLPTPTPRSAHAQVWSLPGAALGAREAHAEGAGTERALRRAPSERRNAASHFHTAPGRRAQNSKQWRKSGVRVQPGPQLELPLLKLLMIVIIIISTSSTVS